MTDQIQDTLIFNNKEYFVPAEILTPYFNQFPGRKPKPGIICSALWRGFVAKFEIKNNELLVSSLAGFDEPAISQEEMKTAFPGGNKLDWYSGFIEINNTYRHPFEEMEEDNIIEVLEINKGNLVRHWKMKYKEYAVFQVKNNS